MKKQLLYLCLATCSLQTAPANAVENWFIYKSSTASWAYDAAMLDRAPSNTNPLTVNYATYTVEPGKYKGRSYHYTTIEIAFNCESRTTQKKTIVVLDNDLKAGATLVSDANTPWNSFGSSDAVGTIGEILLGIGCDGKTPPKGAIASGDLFGTLAKLKSVTK